jgi:Zn-dependent peptidase ImmA (M78 family)
MGHESGHGVCHKSYYVNIRNSMTDHAPLIRCRTDQSAIKKKPASLWTIEDRMEWQANRVSSAILMPRAMVREVARSFENEPPELHDVTIIVTVSRVFNVSYEAAQYRLLDLGLITSRAPVSALLDFAWSA